MVDLDVNHADADRDAFFDGLQRVEIFHRPVRQFEHYMIRVQAIQKVEQRGPMSLLNCLTAIVAEAKMNCALNLDCVKYPIDRFGR